MKIDKKRIKILIVDDDVNYVNQLYGKLQSYGYDVASAFNPVEAKALLLRSPFQIVFLDCLMPEINGYAFAEEVFKVFGSSIRFILMSNVFKKRDFIYMESKNIFSMLEKPVEDNVLTKELDRAILDFLSFSKNKNLLESFCEEGFSMKALYQRLNEYNYINQGDTLVLFCYLLYSKTHARLTLSCDKKKTTYITFKNGSVIHYETDNEEHIRDFLENQELFEHNELKNLIQAHGMKVMKHLIDHGLISPHHYFNYRKASILKSIEYFTNQSVVNVNLEEGEKSIASENFEKYNNVESIPNSYFIEKLTLFIEKRMNQNFFNNFINSFEHYKIILNDNQKLIWMTREISLLSIFNQKDGTFNKNKSVYQFCKLFPHSDQDQIHKSLFLLVSQGAISLKRNNLIQINKLYMKRYQSLYNHLKSLSISQVFEALGCKDLSDKKIVRKIYHHWVKMNHVDKFQEYSEKLIYTIGQCNQIVSNAYDILMDDEKMDDYVNLVSIKEAENFIAIEKYKNNLVQHIKYKQYTQAENLIQNMEDKLGEQSLKAQKDMNTDLLMWKFILEIEKNQYKISSIKVYEMEQRVKKMDKFKVSLDVYFYLFSLFRTCDKNYPIALKFCNKSLHENENFDLALLMKIKLNQMNKKGITDWGSFLTDKKKSS